MSSITEKGQMESTSDEGFNSGGQTTNSSPDVSQKKQRRRKQRRRENKKDGTGSNNEITIKIILTNHKKTYFLPNRLVHDLQPFCRLNRPQPSPRSNKSLLKIVDCYI